MIPVVDIEEALASAECEIVVDDGGGGGSPATPDNIQVNTGNDNIQVNTGNDKVQVGL